VSAFQTQLWVQNVAQYTSDMVPRKEYMDNLTDHRKPERYNLRTSLIQIHLIGQVSENLSNTVSGTCGFPILVHCVTFTKAVQLNIE
jgi:hypothetical protein